MIILTDVDRTLFDDQYMLTAPVEALVMAVARVQAAGHLVGLNSDTPVDSLRPIADQLGLRGPIIAERGQVMAGAPDALAISLDPEAAKFGELKSSVPDELCRRFSAFVGLGDYRTVANQFVSLLSTSQPSTIGVIVNTLRSCSFGCWVRRRTTHSWVIDPAATDAVRRVVEDLGSELGPAWNDHWTDCNHEQGVLIIHHRSSNKGRPRAALQGLFPSQPLVMIGDSLSDWLGPGVIHAAVGNAHPDYRARCQQRSDLSYTAGVIDILNQFMASA